MRQKLMTFIILSLLLFGVSIIQAETSRPETGTYIKDMDRDGYGLLTIHNNWTMDTGGRADRQESEAVAGGLPALQGHARRSTASEDGDYGLYFTVGNLWDAKAGKFAASMVIIAIISPWNSRRMMLATRSSTPYSSWTSTKPTPRTSCPISSSSLTSGLEKDRLHLGARQILSFYAHLPAVRANGSAQGRRRGPPLPLSVK